ncbi:hypothetical protein [Sigmofec virus UA08Rod_4043]|uniref:Uncharacterized protein n=1 Tax=Sigmofec virus UA08Rod_4043 TaxID=2929393 RepID=A0A976R736_9VIRU|nr:hypothetical protein [Sigmofec virus UA08Rod_4043]
MEKSLKKFFECLLYVVCAIAKVQTKLSNLFKRKKK